MLNTQGLMLNTQGLMVHHDLVSVHSCGRNYCDADEVTSIADAMESYGMRELGYEYINLDSTFYSY